MNRAHWAPQLVYIKCDAGLVSPCFVSRKTEARDRGGTLPSRHNPAAGAEVSGPREDRGRAQGHALYVCPLQTWKILQGPKTSQMKEDTRAWHFWSRMALGSRPHCACSELWDPEQGTSSLSHPARKVGYTPAFFTRLLWDFHGPGAPEVLPHQCSLRLADNPRIDPRSSCKQ